MTALTDTESALLGMVDAAEAAGLDAVIEIPDHHPPRSVDLRIMRAGRIVAAMRVRIEGGEWRYEIPARPHGRHITALRTRHLGPVDRPIAVEDLAVLDHWWARIPSTGRLPVPVPPRRVEDTPRWMRPPVPAGS